MTGKKDPDNYVLYKGEEEWSALYFKGELLEVGDHYWVEERLLSELGIDVISSDDFLRGGNSREDVAQTLDEITSYAEGAEAAEAAEEVRLAEERLAAAQLELERARAARAELSADSDTDPEAVEPPLRRAHP